MCSLALTDSGQIERVRAFPWCLLRGSLLAMDWAG
jgi:hypothetical protein